MGRHRSPILVLLVLAAGCGVFELAPKPRLLLLISVDTLRVDRLGVYGSDRGLTPHIDELGRKSQVFTAAYAPTSHTLPSVAALLTGRYPEEIGIWSNYSFLPDSVPTLAGAFRKDGWHTAAVVSNWVLRASAGLDAGFELYDDRFPQLEATRPWPERVAGHTTDAALRALEQCLPDGDGRCFLWVHYEDPHGPYSPPSDWRERFLPREREAADGDRELPVLKGPFGTGGIPEYQYLDEQRGVAFYRAGYDGEIGYLDSELGRLLEALAERGLLDDAVVVFTADHGEALGEEDYWFSHGESLSEPLVRVPLLIRVPGREPGTRSDLVSLVDLYPTLTSLLLDRRREPTQSGRALLADAASSEDSTPYLAALRGGELPSFGVVEGEFKYVVAPRDGVWHGRLVQRDDEEVDLTAPAPHVARAMRARLKYLRLRYRRVEHENLREQSEVDRELLEALGYVQRNQAH
ncbi:MAG: sulfatase [Deltaproteobacteria bacterium]|nr:sulfatase [Deltaproteobacteria bacterium]